MKLHILITSFLLVFSKILFGQQSYQMVNDFLGDNALRGASVGLVISDVGTGKILVAHNPEILLAPASTAKIITSGVTLNLLGPEFQFETILGYTGKINRLTEKLEGDLIIKGGGDPTTGSEWFDVENPVGNLFDEWVESVKSAGISSIQGNLTADVSAFQKWALPPTWLWEDIGNYYGTGPSAINIYDNTVRLFFKSPVMPGINTEIIATKPEIRGVEWINEVRSSEINRDLAYVFGSPLDSKRLIRGTIPANRTNFEVKAAMPNPEIIFGEILKSKLELAGIDFKGEILVSEEEVVFEPLKSFFSPPLAKVCSVLNHESVNLIAESLVMQLAYQKQGFGHHNEGMKIITRFLKENLTSEPCFIDDGSGLSRFSAISARQMVNFLLLMHGSKQGRIFKSTLPAAGMGTLRTFSTVEFPGITLRCKSGSMTRVRAYAGYLICKSGKEVAFSVMVNNFSGSQQEVFRAIEGLMIKARNEF